MKLDFQLDSSVLTRKLRNAGPEVVHAAAASLYQSAEAVMTSAKEEYVPVDTGALRDSGFVELPEIDGSNVLVTMSFGGPAVDYAVIVHEDMTARHPHGGGPKYLQQPLEQRLDEINNKLIEDMNRAMEELK
jgi:hypothetical protein